MEFNKGILVGSQTDTVYCYTSWCGRYRYHKHQTNRGERFECEYMTPDGGWFPIATKKTRHSAEMAILFFFNKQELNKENGNV